MAPRTRREVIVLSASTVLAALAGCGGDGTDGDDGDGNGDGNDGGDAGGGTVTPTDDGGENGDGDTGPTETDATEQGTDDGEAPQLGDAVAFPESYAMTATMSSGGETVEMSGRFYQGDVYWEMTQQGQQMELYVIGNETYVVTQGQCFRGMMQGGMNREDVDPGRFSDDVSTHPEVTAAGRDTIDGEDVLVYEVTASDVTGANEPVTYYVLADSGYLRRIESESMRWDFHSWGEVDPIQKPSGNCQTLPGGTATDG